MIFGVYMCTPRTRPEHHLRTLAYVCVLKIRRARGKGGGVADNVPSEVCNNRPSTFTKVKEVWLPSAP